ncbi:MAG: LysE family translocator [Hyphomicrobiales bacterium]|nr:LysE family translocator [Hyphomicrobiales bacterium]
MTYLATCLAIAIVPGPNVTIIVANSLRSGTRAGFLTVAGTQFGAMLLIFILAAGLSVIMQSFAALFNLIRIVGACYLVYLGLIMWFSDGKLAAVNQAEGSQRSHFWQGTLVLLANPKALLFFGAFIPQFVNPAGDAIFQTIVFGGIFMMTTTLFDSIYALLAGKSGDWLTRRHVRKAEISAGTFLIGGGIWLAIMKRA